MSKKTTLKLNIPYKTEAGHTLILLEKGSFENSVGEFIYTYSIKSKGATQVDPNLWIGHLSYSDDEKFIQKNSIIIEEDWRDEYPGIAKKFYYLGLKTSDIESLWIKDNKAYIIDYNSMIIQNINSEGDYFSCFKDTKDIMRMEILKNAWINKDGSKGFKETK